MYDMSMRSDKPSKTVRAVRKIYLAPVRLYKKFVSPAVNPDCIYDPSCSLYFMQAVERFGIIRGTFTGILRIVRCNRLFLGGPDPVPEDFDLKQIFSRFTVFRRHRKRH